MILSIISEETEQNISDFFSNLLTSIKDFFIQIYDSLISFAEPLIGKTAAGIFVLGLVFSIAAVILIKLINK